MNRNDESNLKRFFNNTFGELSQEEYIVLVAMENGKVVKQIFVKDFYEILHFCKIYELSYDLYFGLATTDGKGRRSENLLSASMIALDFDFANQAVPLANDFTESIRNRIKVQISQVVNSGHGYHIYIPIAKTNDIKKWNEITQRLGSILGADPNALLRTQIMRIPFTTNHKNSLNPERVRLVYSNRNHPASLAKLELIIRNCEDLKGRNTRYRGNRYCIQKLLQGVEKGNRNFALGRIICYFKSLKLSKSEMWEKVCDMNKLNKPPLSETELERTFEAYYCGNYNLNGCFQSRPDKCIQLKKFCKQTLCDYYNTPMSQRVDKSVTHIKIPRKLIEKSVLDSLSGNELALLLYSSFQGNVISKTEIYNSGLFSRPSIVKYMKSLEDKGYICVNVKDIKLSRSIEYSKNISVSADVENRILTGDLKGNNLKVYLYIVNLNYYHQTPTNRDIASAMGIDKSNICEYVNSLVNMELIDNNYIPNGAGIINQLIAA